MISRYSRPEMASIWSDQNKYQTWLEVELLALEKMCELGIAPKEAIKDAREKAKFEIPRIDQLEKELKHDVIAFLTNVAEHIGPASRCMHRGMTSSDLLDTSFAVLLKQSGEMIVAGVEKAINVLKIRSEEFALTPCIGRSHGIHAEPTTFGIKLASWGAELTRCKARLEAAVKEISVGTISGPVGTYAGLNPEIEKFVMQKLGLGIEPVPSQIVHRDRHAVFFNALAVLGSSIERAAVEIRHLQRTEVREVEEKFTVGQKGSSAMPHKRNPILSENLSGLARLLRGYAVSAMENIPLWHERDISHSAVERMIAPDACVIADFMMHRFIGLIEGMVVYPEQMMKNLNLSRGLVFSGSLMLKLVDSGMLRETAYKIVQDHSLETWDGGDDLKTRILKDEKIVSLIGNIGIEEAFSMKNHTKNANMIIERAFK